MRPELNWSGAADAAPLRIKLNISYSGGFCTFCTNWGTADYAAIRVELAYDYNINDVYFDGIQLYKEQFGQSYAYDEDGNLTAVVDVQGQETEYEYSADSDLIRQTLPNGAKLEYTYDDYHNPLTATSGTGVAYFFQYDGYGNNTSVTVDYDTTFDPNETEPEEGQETQETQEPEPPVPSGNGMTASAEYTDDGNRLVKTIDALGNVTQYSYNANTNVLEWVQYPNDTEASRTNYTYDDLYRMATSTTAIDGGSTVLTASYTYTDDLLTAIQTGSTTYSFTYGDFALRTQVRIGSRTLASYAYTDDANRYLQQLTYGNNDFLSYSYDSYGRLTSQSWESGSTVTYTYDNSGALAKMYDSATGRTTTYYYDLTDRLMKYTVTGENHSHAVGYEYNASNNLSSLVETIGGTKLRTSYTYDKDNRPTSVTTVTTQGDTSTTVTEEYTYDNYGRIQTKVTKNGDTVILTESYAYKTVNDKPTTQVASVAVTMGGNTTTYSYTYDDNGNILSVSDGTNTADYAYDSANQLTRENNQAAGKTYTWTYDNAGNIQNRKEYSYTTEALGTVLDTATYTYGEKVLENGWGDLLTGYDGNAITYDEVGNPLNDGTWTYTWEHGRQLASMTSADAAWTFTYDADGMRTGRSNGTSNYSYTYNGGKLTQMSVGNDTLTFTYDASGNPQTVNHNGTLYYYVTNLQGDVISIVDGSGTAVVSYAYDAWGNPITTSGTLSATLGTLNPLRYRGYVYDTETELYYLQSRYYNSEVGRFINADALVSTGQGLLGNNMFAYCLNNPINNADPTGTIGWWILIPIIVIPLLSGCEADRETYGSAWEYEASDSQEYNCYAHALGLDEWKYVGGSHGAVKDYSLKNVASMFESDIEAMGWTIRPLDDYDSPIEEDEFRIALATGPNDYHFMVQHNDGTWSHKPGYLPTISLGDKNPSQVTWDQYAGMVLPNGKMVVFVVAKNYYCNGPVYYAISKGG